MLFIVSTSDDDESTSQLGFIFYQPTSADRNRRVPATNTVCGQIVGHNAARSDDSLLADGNPWANEGLSTNPSPPLNLDRLIAERKGGVTIIMVSATQKCPLRQAAIVANMNRFKVKNEKLFAQPAIISDRQFPGKVNIDTWLDIHAIPNVGSKETQETNLQAVRPRER
nr:hypothetical protein [Crateriforma conspicua]